MIIYSYWAGENLLRRWFEKASVMCELSWRKNKDASSDADPIANFGVTLQRNEGGF